MHRTVELWMAGAAAAVLLVACGGDETPAKASGAASSSASSGGAATGGAGTGAGSGGGGAAGGQGQGGSGGRPSTETNTVLVRDQHGDPVAGAKVVVNDADGTVSGPVLVTDAAGGAIVTVPPDGSVSAFFADGFYNAIRAIHAPPPDTPLVFEFFVNPSPPLSQITVYSIEPIGYPPETVSLDLRGVCDTAFTTSTYLHFSDVSDQNCIGAPQSFAVAARGASDEIVAWGVLPAAPTSPGTIVDLSVAVDQTTSSSIDATITDLPPATTTAVVGASVGLTGLLWFSNAVSASPPAEATFDGHVDVPNMPLDGFSWTAIVGVGDN